MNKLRSGKPAIAMLAFAQQGVARVVPEDLRRHNRALLLEGLFRQGSVSRTALAGATGLTRAAVSRIVDEMIDAGLMREQEQPMERSARGRPQIGVELDPEGAYVIGVGIGAYEQWVRLENQRGDCIERRALRLLRKFSPDETIDCVADAARALIRAARVPERRVLGTVVAVAGVVDQEHGVVVDSPNIGWRDVHVRSVLAQSLRMPVYVEALHHVLNLAQARVRPGHPIDNAVLVNVAMGIGSSAMEQGRIVRGGHAMAGQIGHMHAAGASELCTCGRRGCLDTVASGYAVLRQLGQVPPRRVPREHRAADAKLLIRTIGREHRGDMEVRAAFRLCGEQLGMALDAVRAILDPEQIWLAGPLAGAQSFVEGVRERLAPDPRGHPVNPLPRLSLSSYASDEAAALLALKLFVFGTALDLARIKS